MRHVWDFFPSQLTASLVLEEMPKRGLFVNYFLRLFVIAEIANKLDRNSFDVLLGVELVDRRKGESEIIGGWVPSGFGFLRDDERETLTSEADHW